MKGRHKIKTIKKARWYFRMLFANILPSTHTPLGSELLAACYYHFRLEVPTQFIFLTFIGRQTIEVEMACARVNSFLFEVSYEFGD